MKIRHRKQLQLISRTLNDRTLFHQLLIRLNQLSDAERSGFVEYLASTFHRSELTPAIEAFLHMPNEQWRELAASGSGEDAFNQDKKILPIVDKILKNSLPEEQAEIPHVLADKTALKKSFSRILRTKGLEPFGLTPVQSLVVKFLIYVFDGNYSATAHLLGMSRQSVRECALQAFQKIRNSLNNI